MSLLVRRKSLRGKHLRVHTAARVSAPGACSDAAGCSQQVGRLLAVCLVAANVSAAGAVLGPSRARTDRLAARSYRVDCSRLVAPLRDRSHRVAILRVGDLNLLAHLANVRASPAVATLAGGPTLLAGSTRLCNRSTW